MVSVFQVDNLISEYFAATEQKLMELALDGVARLGREHRLDLDDVSV